MAVELWRRDNSYGKKWWSHSNGKIFEKKREKRLKEFKKYPDGIFAKKLRKKIKGKCRPKILPAQKSVRITDRNSAPLQDTSFWFAVFKSFLHLRLPLTILSFEKWTNAQTNHIPEQSNLLRRAKLLRLVHLKIAISNIS